MELIQIIYDILFYGGALLICVIIVSYIISRSSKEVSHSSQIPKNKKEKKKNTNSQEKINYEQELIRRKSTSKPPKIFQIDGVKPKEVKIIRKPTVSSRETQEEFRLEERNLNKIDGNGSRYKIVNEERKKSNIRAANFYL